RTFVFSSKQKIPYLVVGNTCTLPLLKYLQRRFAFAKASMLLFPIGLEAPVFQGAKHLGNGWQPIAHLVIVGPGGHLLIAVRPGDVLVNGVSPIGRQELRNPFIKLMEKRLNRFALRVIGFGKVGSDTIPLIDPAQPGIIQFW